MEVTLSCRHYSHGLGRVWVSGGILFSGPPLLGSEQCGIEYKRGILLWRMALGRRLFVGPRGIT